MTSIARFEWAISAGYTWGTENQLDMMHKTDPCAEAAAAGNIEVLSHLMGKNITKPDTRALSAALRHGQTQCVRVLMHFCPLKSECFAAAASFGDLEQLKLLRAKGCPWSRSAPSMAAQKGNAEVLLWLLESGCPWERFLSLRAVSTGSVELVRKVHAFFAARDKLQLPNVNAHADENENRLRWEPCLVVEATRARHFQLARWFLDEGGLGWPDEDSFDVVNLFDVLDHSRWARANGKGASDDEWRTVIEWALANGFPWTETVKKAAFNRALYGGHMDALQWLTDEHEVPAVVSVDMDNLSRMTSLLETNAKAGCVEVVKWIIEHSDGERTDGLPNWWNHNLAMHFKWQAEAADPQTAGHAALAAWINETNNVRQRAQELRACSNIAKGLSDFFEKRDAAQLRLACCTRPAVVHEAWLHGSTAESLTHDFSLRVLKGSLAAHLSPEHLGLLLLRIRRRVHDDDDDDDDDDDGGVLHGEGGWLDYLASSFADLTVGVASADEAGEPEERVLDILGWERLADIVMRHFSLHWGDSKGDVGKPGFEGVRPLLITQALATVPRPGTPQG